MKLKRITVNPKQMDGVPFVAEGLRFEEARVRTRLLPIGVGS